MSNAARKQLGLQTDQLRAKSKNEHLPSCDLYVGQNIMVQEPTRKRWYPAVITSLCQEPRNYKVSTTDGVTYRKMQAHLNPYRPQDKQDEDNVKKCHKSTGRPECKKVSFKDSLHNQDQREILNPQLIWTYNKVALYMANNKVSCYLVSGLPTNRLGSWPVSQRLTAKVFILS